MRATLYVIPGSHACRSAMLMLEQKGIAYRVVRFPSGPHPLLVRLAGFPGHRTPLRRLDGRSTRLLTMLDRGGTVPALRIAGQRVQTNHAIARFLDREHPQSPLLPADPDHRAAVEEAERWGDEVLQMAARRIALAGAADGLEGFRNRGNSGRLGPLLASRESARAMASRGAGFIFRANGGNEDELLDALSAMLEQIDAWIADGVLGGEQLNVADFMIVPSLALLAYRVDLRPGIEARPAGALLERVLPEP
jgi:glutathione S-transferase